MNNEFSPIYPAGPRIAPIHPHAAMSPRVAQLWHYFTVTLGWKDAMVSRIAFDSLIAAMQFSRGKPVLDAGAGHKRYQPFFDDCVYLSQEHPAGIAHKNMQGLHYDFVSPIDERIPLKDGSIACIVNTSVLEHTRYPERFLAEAHRVLHPGGRIYMQAPFAYAEHEQPYDFQRPTRYGLQAWLRDAGFGQVSVIPSSNSIYGASWYLAQALREELTARGHAARAAELAPLVKFCLDDAARLTNDHIDVATVMPVGWIAVAQKEGVLGDFPVWDKQRWLSEIAC
jgi:SAM-dependent methyltransferase